jgi:multidrug efflux pump subunit AcrA (membrane-fusion protein)
MASMISKLKPHNSLSSGTVIMTILERRPLHVLAQIGEDKRPDVAAGQQAKIIPPKEDSDRLKAKVKSISAVPVNTGKFAVDFDLTGSELPDWIVAGMSCKAKITTYNKADALVVPKKAVHTDEEDDELKYVWLVDPDDDKAKPERRDVKLGKTSGDDIEVLKGLKKGDVVSLEDESKKEKDE